MKKDRSTLKGYFNTGDKPTQSQFEDLIDSFPNLEEKEYGVMQKITIDFTDFASISNPEGFLNFIALAANEHFSDAYIKPSTLFASPSNSSLQISIYDDLNSCDLSSYSNIDTNSGTTDQLNTLNVTSTNMKTFSQPRNTKIHLLSDTDNLQNFTAGSVDIFYSITLFP